MLFGFNQNPSPDNFRSLGELTLKKKKNLKALNAELFEFFRKVIENRSFIYILKVFELSNSYQKLFLKKNDRIKNNIAKSRKTSIPIHLHHIYMVFSFSLVF